MNWDLCGGVEAAAAAGGPEQAEEGEAGQAAQTYEAQKGEQFDFVLVHCNDSLQWLVRILSDGEPAGHQAGCC